MAVCTYFGQTDCTAPTFGGSGTTTDSSTHLNFFQHIFGTSRASEIIDSVIMLAVLYIVVRFLVLPIARIVLDILDVRRMRNRQLVFLEITPPALSTKTPFATAQLNAGLHNLLNRRTFKDRLLRRKHTLSLEYVATREEGIRFITVLPSYLVELYQQRVISYLPTVRFREIDDYLTNLLANQELRVAEFKQLGHFMYSFAPHEQLAEHDPTAALMRAITKLLPNELSALQLVVAPADRRVANRVRAQLLHGMDVPTRRPWWHYPFIGVWLIVKLSMSILRGMLEIVGDEMVGIRNARPQQGYAPAALSPHAAHVLPTSQAKLDEHLFIVEVRMLIAGQDSAERMEAIANALAQYHVPGYQGFAGRRNYKSKRVYDYGVRAFQDRLPALLTRNSNVLGTSELASLYHFPYGSQVQTENYAKSLTTDLPAPLLMKRRADDNDFAITTGVNHYHGTDTRIGLTTADREKHVYLIGGTGNGKTTLLSYAIVEDMRAGRGLAFIDPHGDAANKLLKYVPESRLKDVVYLNPLDIKHPIGINLLELPEGLDEDDLLIEKERVTEAVVGILRKVFDDDTANAHRIEGMLRNAILTAYTVPGATLFTVLKLIRNADYRKEVVDKLEDEHLKDFWLEEFGQAGGMQRVSMTKGLTHRIDRFRSSEPVYRMFNQTKSTISFEDIMNSGKILICNFTTDMGEDTSALFGTMVLAKLKIAAERRYQIPEEERRPFYTYVDEFQNFATTPFVKMLSSSRKYGLFLTIAQQSTDQQDDQHLTGTILANVSTLICFRTNSPNDERLLLPWFTPSIEQGAIGNLPSYHYYMRLKATEPMEPISGMTVQLETAGSIERSNEVIATSRELYGVDYKALVAQQEEDKQAAIAEAAKKDSMKPEEKNNTPKRRAIRKVRQPKGDRGK